MPAQWQTWSGVYYHLGSLDTSFVKFMSYHAVYFQGSNQVKDLQTDRSHVYDFFFKKIVYQVCRAIFLFQGVEDFWKAKLTRSALAGEFSEKPQHWG